MDPNKIFQVINNLLSNAIKFSGEDSTVSVGLLKYGNELEFRVDDEGVGIPDEELESVFDKFAQSSRTKTSAGGTGLGLAICQLIIEDHGGRIWVENSQKGSGFIFRFTLPSSPVLD